jgi:hypothetical protein
MLCHRATPCPRYLLLDDLRLEELGESTSQVAVIDLPEIRN